MEQRNDELMRYGVLGMKWGQRRARKYSEKAGRASAKGNKTAASKYAAKSKKIESYHKNMAGKKTYDRVKKMSTGKALAQSYVFGTYGAMKYNQARAKGVSRGKAAVNGLLYDIANHATAGVTSVVEPRINREKRK